MPLKHIVVVGFLVKVMYCVGTQVMNVIATFSAPKATILDHPLGLEASPSNPERALSLQLRFPMSLQQLVVNLINI